MPRQEIARQVRISTSGIQSSQQSTEFVNLVNNVPSKSHTPLSQFSAGAFATMFGTPTGPLAGALVVVGAAAGMAAAVRSVRGFEISQSADVQESGRSSIQS